MASWGCCVEPLDRLESYVLLELKVLYEGVWKLDGLTAFSQHLVMQVTLKLHTLLKVVPKAHLELQVMLIDIEQYKPSWFVGGVYTMT